MPTTAAVPTDRYSSSAAELVRELRDIAERYISELPTDRPTVDACMLVIYMGPSALGVPSAIAAHALLGKAIQHDMAQMGNIHEYTFKLYDGLFTFLDEYHDYDLTAGKWTPRPRLAMLKGPGRVILRATSPVPGMSIEPGDDFQLIFGPDGVGMAYDGDGEPSDLTALGLRDIAGALRSGALVRLVPPSANDLLRAVDAHIAALEAPIATHA